MAILSGFKLKFKKPGPAILIVLNKSDFSRLFFISLAISSGLLFNFLDDLWYHVAISWGSEIGMQIYIDGILHATNNEFIGTLRNDSWCCLEMGRTSSENLHYFNGNIDNVSI